ncbi:MAG TPA: DUF488 domain-containing protein [Steroidobacter sp.]
MPSRSETSPVFTVGHSTRPTEELIGLLKSHGVKRLIDVRTVPRSRRNPQFNRENFPAALEAEGITYTHMPGLGGFRRPRSDSPNLGWHNLSFRGYADYMQTDEFEQHLAELIEWARACPVAVMCAEAVPWRCHRSLIADALLVRGVPVEEIVSPARTQPHKLTSFARVEGTKVTYPMQPKVGGS